jgi:transposase
MKYYSGLDVAMKDTFICIVDEEGNKVYETKASSTPAAIFKSLEISGFQIEKVGIETGSLTRFLIKGLKNLGVPAICIDSRKMSAILSVTINKTDKNDARGIADAIRCNHFKEIYVKSDEDASVEILLKSRKTLVHLSGILKNAIRGFLKTYGVLLGDLQPKNFSEKVREKFQNIPQEAGDGIESLLKSFETNSSEIDIIDQKIKILTAKNKQVKLLMTVPGVGPIIAANFVFSLGEADRFKKSQSVGAYFGMTPRQYSSGETVSMGRISKCGDADMRRLLTNAAMVLMTKTKSWCPLKAWGIKISKKHGSKKAFMAVGRKLAVIMHRMLITGEVFRYTTAVKV